MTQYPTPSRAQPPLHFEAGFIQLNVIVGNRPPEVRRTYVRTSSIATIVDETGGEDTASADESPQVRSYVSLVGEEAGFAVEEGADRILFRITQAQEHERLRAR